MEKSIHIAKQISKDHERSWLPELEEINFHSIFKPVYGLNLNLSNASLLIPFCIYSYDPDSPKLIIQKDRYENKVQIAESLGLDINNKVIEDILNNDEETFNDVVLNYLYLLTDWRWPAVFTSLEYSSKMFRFVNQNTDEEKSFQKMNKEGIVKDITQEYDIDTISKVNIQKSELLKRAISAREDADKLLASIKKDMMPADHAVQQDFGFDFSDTSKKKVDIESWRHFIENRKKSVVAQR